MRSHLLKLSYFSSCHVFQNLAARIPQFAIFKEFFDSLTQRMSNGSSIAQIY